MSSTNVYIIAVADHMGGAVKHAIMHNQPNNLGMLNQNVKRGLRIFESWMEDHGGRVLLCEGDTVTAELPGEHLESLPQLHSQVQDAWGDGITIGIGLDLKEAYKACENGKKRGGKRIVFYAPEIEQHLNEESYSESHDAKNNDGDPEELKELGLKKANSPSPGPPTPNEGAAFSAGPAASPPSAPSPFAAGQAQPSGADMPPPPSSTNAAEGLSPVEAQMREMAGHGEAEAARAEGHANAADDGTTGPAQLKQGIARILLKVKEQAQVLEQLKEQAPEAYTAILGMVQVVAAIGKQLAPQAKQDEGEPVQKSYTIEDNTDVRQLRRSYEVEGVQTAPVKNTGINQQVNVQDHIYPTNKEEFEPHEAPPLPGRLDKIRKAAMQKKAPSISKEEWKPSHCETPDCPNKPKDGGFLCPDCEKKYPFPYRPPADSTDMEKALPMPEEAAKLPPKVSGSLLSRLRGDASPQVHKYFHQTPGEAAHVGMDGKPEGKNVTRQFQSGKILPINARAETDTGQTHPVSALNPTDSEGREKQKDPNQPLV